jgi:hypothetical protein
MNYNSTHPNRCVTRTGCSAGLTASVPGVYRSYLHQPTQIVEIPTTRETHLAKKALPMRLPTSSHCRNPLKNSGLQRHELQLHIPGQMRLPGGVLGPPDRAGPRCFPMVKDP